MGFLTTRHTALLCQVVCELSLRAGVPSIRLVACQWTLCQDKSRSLCGLCSSDRFALPNELLSVNYGIVLLAGTSLAVVAPPKAAAHMWSYTASLVLQAH